MKNNLEQAWREHFVLEEDMLEITATCMTPKPVLEASVLFFLFLTKLIFSQGHVERFSDLIVKDVKIGTGFRADKLLIEVNFKLNLKT
jgi:glycyl-tRNA synthetase